MCKELINKPLCVERNSFIIGKTRSLHRKNYLAPGRKFKDDAQFI